MGCFSLARRRSTIESRTVDGRGWRVCLEPPRFSGRRKPPSSGGTRRSETPRAPRGLATQADIGVARRRMAASCLVRSRHLRPGAGRGRTADGTMWRVISMVARRHGGASVASDTVRSPGGTAHRSV